MCFFIIFKNWGDQLFFWVPKPKPVGHQWEADKTQAAGLAEMKQFREAILEGVCFGAAALWSPLVQLGQPLWALTAGGNSRTLGQLLLPWYKCQ